MKTIKLRRVMDKVIYTVVATVLLCVIIVTMIVHTRSVSENEAYEKLHMQTQQIKKDLNLQMLSDRENLLTMASFAAELYDDGEDFDIIFNAFKEIGLFEYIGMLLPDSSFITKTGVMNLGRELSFYEEIEKGEYISGRVSDFTYEDRQVVRSAVPVKVKDGSTVAILYGVINLEKLRERYEDDAVAIGADLFVIEGGNGNLLINTKQVNIESITELSVTKFNKNFSYNQLVRDLSNEKDGYTSFVSLVKNEYIYAHYAPLDFSDWQIMLLQPEDIVFAGAHATINYLTVIVSMILLVIVLYVVLIFASERKKLKISKNASNIRKCLLGMNQQFDRIYQALKSISEFADAQCSFVIDSTGENYEYINPDFVNKYLQDKKEDFTSFLWNYIAKNHKYNVGELYVTKITADKKLSLEMPAFYDFLRKRNIKTVNFACIFNSDANTSILGVINEKNQSTEEILRDIAVCFTMAIFNQKHLEKTETMALVDALTGTFNRMAYNEDIKQFDGEYTSELACIYVDVNELNYYNNNYGHAAGDQMLKFIAEVLKKEFSDYRVYRMGGDEFLIFTNGISSEVIAEKISVACKKIDEMKYHISVGIKHGEPNVSIEELVVAAEKLMYDEKARYYQSKETLKMSQLANRAMEADLTGIKEIDACMSVMSMRYLGVFCLAHKADSAFLVLSTSYFSEMIKSTHSFSEALKNYIHELVKPEYHRLLLSFLEYDALENNIRKGNTPKITYTKIDGEQVALSIYPNNDQRNDEIDTIWIFEKKIK